METRRSFLRKSLLVSGVAGLSTVLPESIQRAFAIEPDPGTTYLDAEHVVILMQENRSFDHALGTLRGVRGFNDPRALRQPNGNSVFLQTNAAGETYAPWRLDIHNTRVTWLGSLPHTRDSQVDAWNEGHHNRWLDAKKSSKSECAHMPLTMGYYTREDIPFYYALADAFTVCDQHYCGIMSSTEPNRVLSMSGTLRDRQSVASKVYLRNPAIAHDNLRWVTYPERLQKAGIPWKFYQNDISAKNKDMSHEEVAWLSNYDDNVLEYFASYNVKPAAPLSAAEQDLHNRAFVTNAGDPDYRTLDTITFQDGAETRQMKVPKGDVLHQFRDDVNKGKLPAVSWIAAPKNFSDHPSAPWYGAWYVAEVMDILTKNPEVWKKTIFILTYDENDGYFDHGPVYAAADPRRKETGGASSGIDTGLEYAHLEDEAVFNVPAKEARNGPVGLGYRVPMIIASPWSRGGWVNSQLCDHTSKLKFLEHFVQYRFKRQVEETNISPWRRAICGDLSSAFRPYDGKKPSLPSLERNAFVESIERARYKEIPAGYKALSAEEVARIQKNPRTPVVTQEPGVRPSCAIPYELYADGALSVDRKSFALQLRAGNTIFGAGSAGAPFNVYLFGRKDAAANMSAATYVVKAGDALEESFALPLFAEGRYEIAVHGPNGFFREFKGDSSDPAIEVACVYQAKMSGNIEVHIASKTGSETTVEIVDNAYGAAAITRTIHAGAADVTVLRLEKQHGWYDFSVKIAGSNCVRRYAGRVETGKPSTSDPFMGGVV